MSFSKEVNDYIIRDYLSSDFLSITSIWLQCDLGNPARGDNNLVIERTLKTGGKFIVMENTQSNELFACAWITNDGRRLYLHHFGVLPEYQRKGYGKILMDYCLDYAQKTGLQIKLEVHKNNHQAVQLYEKGGFKYLGDYKVYIIRDYNKI